MTHFRACTTILTAVLACTVATPAAVAQSVYLDLSPQTSPVVNTALASVGASSMSYYTRGASAGARGSLAHALVESGAPVLPATGAMDFDSLDFAPSAAVTRDTNQRIVRALAPHVHAANRTKLQQLVDSGELLQSFDALLSKFNYRPNNLADVMTAYIILSWETIHDADATRFPHGIDAVHQRVRYAMAANPHTAAFTDAQKQGFAQVLAYMAMLNVVDRKRLQASGDSGKLHQLEQNVDAQTRNDGLDLGALQLTDTGFVAMH